MTTSDTATCPYCNAALPPLPLRASADSGAADGNGIAKGLPAPARGLYTACPRCGEPVLTERFPTTAAAPAPPVVPAPPSLAERKRHTARWLLALMVGMAALALVFALMTQKWRREHDFKYKSNATLPAFAEPARLPGLGYLPKGCNLAAAVHFAALREDDAGRALLREPRPKLLDEMLRSLQGTGLTLEDIDHIVVGTELTGFLPPPRITTVIVTREPYDPERVKRAAKPKEISATTYRGRPLYRFTNRADIPKLWCADSRVLVYTTLTMEEMEQIPANIKEPVETLTPAARDALTVHIEKQSRIWAVGDLTPAKDLINSLQKFPLGPMREPVRLLGLVRTFAVGITTGEAQSVTVRGDFYTGNPAATQELAKALGGVTVAGATSQKVVTPPADLPAPDAQWVGWQLRADAKVLRDAVGKLPLTPQ